MSKKKVIFASAAANIFEWYDYALFGYCAHLIGRNFLQAHTETGEIFNAFIIFAAGFFARPLGAIFFGVMGDTRGRKTILSNSVMIMSIPSAMIGLLPNYTQIGILAPFAIFIIRILQGFAMGGALTGSVTFLIEHMPKQNRGLAGSITMASLCIGILTGTLTCIFCKFILGEDAFEEYGWRIPFLLSFSFIIVSYVIKKTKETPSYNSIKVIVDNPIKYCFINHSKDMLFSALINSSGSVLFYSVVVFIPNYLRQARSFNEINLDLLLCATLAMMSLVCLISGYISDITTRRSVFYISLVMAVISTYFSTVILQNGRLEIIIIMYIFQGVIAAFYIGPEPGLQTDLFPVNIRATALAISYNFSASFFGGSAPLVISYLHAKTGKFESFALYFTITSLMSFAGLYLSNNNRYGK
ncbi:MAG: MFS transporter [Rickettsiaceae bacterium]|nr:MFS transporter [Rickettsiaceae bacterium]